MGVEWDGTDDTSIVLKPFLETATYRNVVATRAAVVNITDDIRVFARAAISSPEYPTVPAVKVRGAVLADCCAWRELEVTSIDSTPPRSRVDTLHHPSRFQTRVHRLQPRASAVLEMAIYATRLHLLPRDFIERELARLQVIVDKTAGPREFEAMASACRLHPFGAAPTGRRRRSPRLMLTDETVFVETAARLHFGVLDLRGSLGRWFGGIGAAAHAPSLLVSAQANENPDSRGRSLGTRRDFRRAILASHSLDHGVHIRVHRMLPSHAGLGSGTQLALAIAASDREV
jgi:hypothetical protein